MRNQTSGFPILLFVALNMLLVYCSGDRDAESKPESQWTIIKGEVMVKVSIPAGQAASLGTYQATITMPGRAMQNIEGRRDGSIADVWLENLGPNRIPHLIIWMTSAGSGAYGFLALYEQQEGGFVPVQLAPLAEQQTHGYMGHDTYAVKEGHLFRDFPIYRPGDPNTHPTGGETRYRYLFDEDRWIRVDDAL